MNKLGVVGWCLYDWANSAFTTIVITFVFATYFARSVAADPTTGTSQWGFAVGMSGVAVALLAPIMGAIADHGGRRKPWIAAFTGLCVVMTAALYFVEPDPGFVIFALISVVLANIGFEIAIVFNNAMLPDIAPRHMIGRISGWAWGLGYGGGLACLAVILVGFDTSSLVQVRATSVLVAGWVAVFSLPLFLWTPDIPATGAPAGEAVRHGLATLGRTLRNLPAHREVVKFLVARLIYNDGLVTLFAMGGVFAAAAYGMTTDQVLQFAVIINIASGLGAAAFAWLDDWIGPKRTILISVAGLAVTGLVVLLVDDITLFLVLGAVLGIFVGPAQAASRSMMAHLAPASMQAEFFGLYAFSGKATAFVGPFLFGIVTTATDSARAGMATILVFFVAGGLILLSVTDARHGPATDVEAPPAGE